MEKRKNSSRKSHFIEKHYGTFSWHRDVVRISGKLMAPINTEDNHVRQRILEIITKSSLKKSNVDERKRSTGKSEAIRDMKNVPLPLALVC